MSEFDSLFLSVCEGAMPTEALADWIGDRMGATKQWKSTVVTADGPVLFVVNYYRATRSVWAYLTWPGANCVRDEKMFVTIKEFMDQFPIWLRSALGDNVLGRTEEVVL